MTQYMALWTTGQIASKANDWHGNNYHRWSNADYDNLYKQLQTETDPAKRADIIIKMNDILVSQVVVIPLVARTQPTDGISKQIKGDIPEPVGLGPVERRRLDEDGRLSRPTHQHFLATVSRRRRPC